MNAFVDTGSMLRFVNSSIAATLGVVVKLEKPITVATATGQTVNIDQKIDSLIVHKKQEYRQALLVMPTMKFNLVLGVDFMKLSHLQIHFDDLGANADAPTEKIAYLNQDLVMYEYATEYVPIYTNQRIMGVHHFSLTRECFKLGLRVSPDTVYYHGNSIVHMRIQTEEVSEK